jgi:hypothetical protein
MDKDNDLDRMNRIKADKRNNQRGHRERLISLES